MIDLMIDRLICRFDFHHSLHAPIISHPHPPARVGSRFVCVPRWAIVSRMTYDEIDTAPLRGAIRRIIRSDDDLEPNIWMKGAASPRLKKGVRETLMALAQDFWGDLAVGGAKLLDVTLTGSCAGYRWTSKSDLDVHLIVQYSDVNEYEVLVGSYFKARTAMWDDDHDIELWEHPVEIYVQDVDEVQWFSGVYSLMQDKWLVQPIPPDADGDDIDLKAVERKARTYARDIARTVADLRGRPTGREISRAKKIKARIRQLRRGGLEREGELSIENLAFKALRKIGALDILHSALNDAYDISHSLP